MTGTLWARQGPILLALNFKAIRGRAGTTGCDSAAYALRRPAPEGRAA